MQIKEKKKPLSADEPAQEHADHQAATAEDDVDGHRYSVRECRIIQERNEIEKRDLNQVSR